MKAAVLERVGDPLRIEELTIDPVRPGEVRVAFRAAGVCHSDVHQADGAWGDLDPIVLGHEGAGVIESVGPGVADLRAGDTVTLNWFLSCQNCRECRRGRPWLCGHVSGDGRRQDGSTPLHRQDGSPMLSYAGLGTFAEAAVVPADAAIRIPPDVPPEVGALIGCAVTTGVMAVLRTARVTAGSSVLVVGLGGVGLSVVMGAALAGATRIVAMDLSPEKLEMGRLLGATDLVLAQGEEENLEAILALCPGGVDYSFEAIGVQSTIELAVNALAGGGSAVLVGMTSTDATVSFHPLQITEGGRRIIGSNYGSSIPAVDFPMIADLYLAGRLPIDRLVGKRISLAEVNSAMEALRRGEGLRSVVVF